MRQLNTQEINALSGFGNASNGHCCFKCNTIGFWTLSTGLLFAGIETYDLGLIAGAKGFIAGCLVGSGLSLLYLTLLSGHEPSSQR